MRAIAMSAEYLLDLPLSYEEKDLIASLNFPTGVALLAALEASPEAFKNYLGRQLTQKLTRILKDSLNSDERALLDTPTFKFHATGALIEHQTPSLMPPNYDLSERDRLFSQLQDLRQQQKPSPETLLRIRELEERLNKMLETA